MSKSGSGRVYVNKGVSFPPPLLSAAEERAQNLGLTFSRYLQKCVEEDLAKREPLVFRETAHSVIPPARKKH